MCTSFFVLRFSFLGCANQKKNFQDPSYKVDWKWEATINTCWEPSLLQMLPFLKLLLCGVYPVLFPLEKQQPALHMFSVEGSRWVGSNVEIQNVDNPKPTHNPTGMCSAHTLEQGCVSSLEKQLQVEASDHPGNYLTWCTKARWAERCSKIPSSVSHSSLTMQRLLALGPTCGEAGNASQPPAQLAPEIQPKSFLSVPRWCQRCPLNTSELQGGCGSIHVPSCNCAEEVIMSTQNFNWVTTSEKETMLSEQGNLSTSWHTWKVPNLCSNSQKQSLGLKTWQWTWKLDIR